MTPPGQVLGSASSFPQALYPGLSFHTSEQIPRRNAGCWLTGVMRTKSSLAQPFDFRRTGDAVHPIRLLARRPPVSASVSRPPRHKSSPVILLSPEAAREFRHRAEPDGGQGKVRVRSQPPNGLEAEPTERPTGGVRPQHRRGSQPARSLPMRRLAPLRRQRSRRQCVAAAKACSGAIARPRAPGGAGGSFPDHGREASGRAGGGA